MQVLLMFQILFRHQQNPLNKFLSEQGRLDIQVLVILDGLIQQIDFQLINYLPHHIH
jgi:hypothetical protein